MLVNSVRLAGLRGVALAVVLGFCLTGEAPAQTLAQLSLPSTSPQTAAGIRQEGLYLSAPISVDGVPIFRIAAPVDAPTTQLPIATRVDDVQTDLAELLATTGSGAHVQTVYDPRTIRVHVRRQGDVALLQAVDAKHPDPLPILTVTSVDAQYEQVSVDTLATEWQSILQSTLIRALELRQPATERRSTTLVAWVALALGLASLAVWATIVSFSRRIAALTAEVAARGRATQAEQSKVAQDEAQVHRRRRRFLALALQQREPAAQLALYRATSESLVWGMVLVWFVAITWSLSLFAQTASVSQAISRATFAVAATIIITGLVNRFLDLVITRVAAAWRIRTSVTSEERARLLLRVPTIASTLAGFKTFLLVFVAGLSILSEIGVSTGSVLTIGGLTAIALSLAAQNFVRDFLNGFLVLFEDQYVVGDFVSINIASGIVERLTLRMVQIRNAAGDLITIPHSSVTSVVNQSRNWSRVDFRVPVDPAADIARAIALVREAIESVAKDEAWQQSIFDPIEWIGIDALSKDGVVIRASVKTAPLRQFELRRVINDRVQTAFAQAQIGLGAPLAPGL